MAKAQGKRRSVAEMRRGQLRVMMGVTVMTGALLGLVGCLVVLFGGDQGGLWWLAIAALFHAVALRMRKVYQGWPSRRTWGAEATLYQWVYGSDERMARDLRANDEAWAHEMERRARRSMPRRWFRFGRAGGGK